VIKIIYPYIHSKWGEELKYSLRSLDTYFTDPFEVWIMGDVPEYVDLSTITHIKKEHKNFKQVNLNRLYDLAHHLPKNENFIWMNDDIFLLSNLNEELLKYPFVMGDLSLVKKRGKRAWQKKLFITSDFLKSKNYTTYNYECHVPTLYNVDELLKTFDFVKSLDVWLINTAYYNYNNYFDKSVSVKKYRLGKYNSKKDKPLPKNINDYLFLNFDDNGLTQEIKDFLFNKYPNKSKFEI